MTKENYLEAMAIRKRIDDLGLIKTYLTGIFINTPVMVKIESNILGHKSQLNESLFTPKTYVEKQITEDCNYLLCCIEDRINFLENEFNKL